MALLFLLLPILLIVMLTRVGTVSAASLADLATTGPDRALFERFFERSRRFRRGGAVAGWGVALLAATMIATDSGNSDGATLDLGLVASLALGGSVAGSVLAEAFRVRRTARTARTVSLEVRDPSNYDDELATRRERVVVVIAALAVGLAVVVGADTPTVAALAVLVVGLAALRRWSIERIAHRSRPAMSRELAAVDDRIRRLAASVGLGRPMVTLQAIVVSWQFRVLTEKESAFALLTWAVLITSFVWWHQNRSFGLIERARTRGLAPSGARVGLLAAGTIFVLVGLLIAVRSSA